MVGFIPKKATRLLLTFTIISFRVIIMIPDPSDMRSLARTSCASQPGFAHRLLRHLVALKAFGLRHLREREAAKRFSDPHGAHVWLWISQVFWIYNESTRQWFQERGAIWLVLRWFEYEGPGPVGATCWSQFQRGSLPEQFSQQNNVLATSFLVATNNKC